MHIIHIDGKRHSAWTTRKEARQHAATIKGPHKITICRDRTVAVANGTIF